MRREMKLSTLFIVLALAWLAGVGYVFPTKAIAPAREIGIFHLSAYAPGGGLLWEEDAHNSLADEGEQLFLDCVLRATSCPSQFYVRLVDSTASCSISDTNTLATAAALGEPSTNGYAAQLIERNSTGWPTLAPDSGDYMATSSVETFSASGGSWGPVYCVMLGTSSDNTGKLVSYAALSQARTLASGESLQITYKVKLQ
jgi:hypothetical protein